MQVIHIIHIITQAIHNIHARHTTHIMHLSPLMNTTCIIWATWFMRIMHIIQLANVLHVIHIMHIMQTEASSILCWINVGQNLGNLRAGWIQLKRVLELSDYFLQLTARAWHSQRKTPWEPHELAWPKWVPTCRAIALLQRPPSKKRTCRNTSHGTFHDISEIIILPHIMYSKETDPTYMLRYWEPCTPRSRLSRMVV